MELVKGPGGKKGGKKGGKGPCHGPCSACDECDDEDEACAAEHCFNCVACKCDGANKHCGACVEDGKGDDEKCQDACEAANECNEAAEEVADMELVKGPGG